MGLSEVEKRSWCTALSSVSVRRGKGFFKCRSSNMKRSPGEPAVECEPVVKVKKFKLSTYNSWRCCKGDGNIRWVF